MINKIALWNPMEIQKNDSIQNEGFEELSNEIKF